MPMERRGRNAPDAGAGAGAASRRSGNQGGSSSSSSGAASAAALAVATTTPGYGGYRAFPASLDGLAVAEQQRQRPPRRQQQAPTLAVGKFAASGQGGPPPSRAASLGTAVPILRRVCDYNRVSFPIQIMLVCVLFAVCPSVRLSVCEFVYVCERALETRVD